MMTRALAMLEKIPSSSIPPRRPELMLPQQGQDRLICLLLRGSASGKGLTDE